MVYCIVAICFSAVLELLSMAFMIVRQTLRTILKIAAIPWMWFFRRKIRGLVVIGFIILAISLSRVMDQAVVGSLKLRENELVGLMSNKSGEGSEVKTQIIWCFLLKLKSRFGIRIVVGVLGTRIMFEGWPEP